MGRKNKKVLPSDSEQDVDHNRPTLAHENEMLIEENIRLVAKLAALQRRLDFYMKEKKDAD